MAGDGSLIYDELYIMHIIILYGVAVCADFEVTLS